MWGQQKKHKFLRAVILAIAAVLACSGVTAGVSLVQVPAAVSVQSLDDGVHYWTKYKAPDYANTSETNPKECLIASAQELALFNYELSNGIRNYSDWTITLVNDIDLSGDIIVDGSGSNRIEPWWTPIKTTRNELVMTDELNEYGNYIIRNELVTVDNITFNGNGKKIKNMKVRINAESARDQNYNWGLFGDFVGGSVLDLTLENITIEVDYSEDYTTQQPADNAKPTAPIEFNLGAFAGTTHGTHFQNVQVVNSQISLENPDYNAHQFHLGGAVGKMSYRYLPGEVKPEITVLESVKVEDTSIGLIIPHCGLGEAVLGDVGGLAGLNENGRIMNCTVASDVTISTSLGMAQGSYAVGGLVGRSLICGLHSQKAIMTTGLMNNLVFAAPSTTSSANVLAGIFAGKVVTNWLYANFFFGTSSLTMWGSLDNDSSVPVYSTNCVGYDHYAALDPYFAQEETDCHSSNGVCAIHGGYYLANDLFRCANTLNTIDAAVKEKNNYRSDTVGGILRDNAGVNLTNGTTGQGFSSLLPELNNFTGANSALNILARIIVYYDFNYSIDNQTDAQYLKHLRNAVGQFCLWQYNAGPSFGDSLNKQYAITFNANPLSGHNAGWLRETENNADDDWDDEFDIDEEYAEEELYYQELYEYYRAEYDIEIKKKVLYKRYKELAEPLRDVPVMRGFAFTGWYRDAECRQPWVTYNNGTFNTMNNIEMGLAPVEVYAGWRVNTWRVTYKVDGVAINSGVANQQYGSFLTKPSNPDGQGRTFLGWFLRDNFDAGTDIEKANIVAQNSGLYWNFTTNTMPDCNLTLYAGWFNNYYELQDKIASVAEYLKPDVAQYYANIKKLELACQQAEAFIKNRGNINLIGKCISDIDDAVAGLVVDIVQLQKMPQLTSLTLPANRYPFLYTKTAYKEYQTAVNSANVYIKLVQAGDAYNRSSWYELKSRIERLEGAYNSLDTNKNPALVNTNNSAAFEKQLTTLMTDYETLSNLAKTRDYRNYTEESWAPYREAVERFETTFNSDCPSLSELQAAVRDLQTASSGLRRVAGSGSDLWKPITLPISPVVLGIIIVAVLAVVAGGWIGIDAYLKFLRKPKVAPVGKQKQTAATVVDEHEPEDYYV